MSDDLVARLRASVTYTYMPMAIRQQLAEAADLIESLSAEVARFKKLTAGQWFYAPDGYESESCLYSPDEVIDYLDLDVGDHVIEVNVATSLPSIWCAVRVTDDEDADERYTFTEHASEDAAREALSVRVLAGEGCDG